MRSVIRRFEGLIICIGVKICVLFKFQWRDF